MATEIIWWAFAIITAGAAAGVVFSRSVIHAAIFLIVSLAGVGAIYVLLTVEFLALVQFLIYGGAVTVLVLLALMLTRMGAGGNVERASGPQAPFGILVALGLAAILAGVAVGSEWPGDTDDQPAQIAIGAISEKLFMDFGAPFVIASAVLLVALVGAIILARTEDD